MPRKKKTEEIDLEIIKDLLDRKFPKEIEHPTTLWEALELMQTFSEEINKYLSSSPLVQDYVSMHAKRVGKSKGSFQLNFTPTIEFVATGRTITRTPNKKKQAEPKKPKTKTLSKIEQLQQKAKGLDIDISDINDDLGAIQARISLVESFTSTEEKPQKGQEHIEEEIIILEPNRKRRKPKVRVRSMVDVNQGTRDLSRLGSVLETLQTKELDSISEYVSTKNKLDSKDEK